MISTIMTWRGLNFFIFSSNSLRSDPYPFPVCLFISPQQDINNSAWNKFVYTLFCRTWLSLAHCSSISGWRTLFQSDNQRRRLTNQRRTRWKLLSTSGVQWECAPRCDAEAVLIWYLFSLRISDSFCRGAAHSRDSMVDYFLIFYMLEVEHRNYMFVFLGQLFRILFLKQIIQLLWDLLISELVLLISWYQILSKCRFFGKFVWANSLK